MGDIVIGSGPAGVSTAKALIAQGRDVMLLDVGEQLEPEHAALRSRLGSIAPDSWAQSDVSSILGPTDSEQSDIMRPFGSDFLFRDPVDLFGSDGPPEDVQLRPSFATGGLSNGWGASVLPYRTEDLDGWPIGAAELAPHYEAVRNFMPIAARPDDLASLFPALQVRESCGLPLSSQASHLLGRLEDGRDGLRAKGVHFGQARVAVSGSECRKCRMCLYGCPYELIFNASTALDQLIAHERFTYRRGCYVTRFEESADGVRVSARDLSDGSELSLMGDRLFVGCGVLPTAQLVLSSLEQYDAPLALKDSQHFYLPFLHTWWPRPDPADEALHTLTQIFLEIIDPEIESRTVHVQLYTHNDFYAADMRKRLGSLAGLAAPLIAQLSRRLIVAQGFLHSDVSPEIELSLIKSGEGSDLRMTWKDEPRAGATISRVRRRLARALGRAGLLALLPLSRLGAVGSSFHCGGSFPMRARPSGLETDTLGRPAGLQRVFLVDASVFPSIPATTITLSVMANAHRIGTDA